MEDFLIFGKVYFDVVDKNGYIVFIGVSVSYRSRKLNLLILKMLCKKCLRLDMFRIYCFYYLGFKSLEIVIFSLVYKIKILV